MRVDVTFRNIPAEEHAAARELLESLGARRVAKALGRLAGKAPRMHATLERHRSGERVRARLRVAVPGAVLVSHEVGPTLQETIHEAVYELARQARRYAARMEHRGSRRRRGERRPALGRLRAALAEAPAAEQGGEALARGQVDGDRARTFLAAAGEDLQALHQFVRHELTYLRTTGELAPAIPTLDDVLDEVLARALDDLPRRQAEGDGESSRAWLLQLAMRYLDEERAQAQRLRARLPLDERVTPPAGALVDDEMMDFWQPDEVLRVEDLIPTDWEPQEPSGEGETAGQTGGLPPREAALLAHQLLAQVPHTWRRALTLRDLYGLTDDEAAAALATDPTEVARWSEAAAHFVDERSRGLGVALDEHGGARRVLGVSRTVTERDAAWDEAVRAALG